MQRRSSENGAQISDNVLETFSLRGKTSDWMNDDWKLRTVARRTTNLIGERRLCYNRYDEMNKIAEGDCIEKHRNFFDRSCGRRSANSISATSPPTNRYR